MAVLVKLTDTVIHAAEGKEKFYQLADDGGLHIPVKPRWW